MALATAGTVQSVEGMASGGPDPANQAHQGLALALSGGGARSAYQVGLLCALANHLPEVRFPLITGVSAGAINAAFLAAHAGSPAEAAGELSQLWARLTIEEIFRIDVPFLARNLGRWATHLVAGGSSLAPEVRGLLDTRPLYATIRRASASIDGEIIGIARNLAAGRLQAVALSALNYTTGQTVTWIQGEPLPGDHPGTVNAVPARLGVRHVMASSALPLVFPAVRLGDAWYGDGGVRLLAPLAPALHLGARRILAISPQFRRNAPTTASALPGGYPPPAQILSHMLNTVFLDVLEQDVDRLEQVSRLLRKIPEDQWGGQRPVRILVLRPSVDLGALAAEHELRLPAAFRYLVRSLGTRETSSTDFLSYLLFEPEYLTRLIEIGERDAEARLPEIRRLLEA
jgi:NTE family protein